MTYSYFEEQIIQIFSEAVFGLKKPKAASKKKKPRKQAQCQCQILETTWHSKVFHKK